ncbi:EexN family lipoprotein [Bartonella sp. AU55XJBT]|uniref:EexN family lipoprotein n=1 Tax=Bartonella sp. AU55XJBT TaxID=3019091 RepID=UPI002360E4B2|nr:EexN family lipoprotein [Bartonella sp. AU55XJBT]
MNKIIITTLLLCTGLIAAGCEKTYSVAEFKKDEKLFDEWVTRCGGIGTSKNCENLRVAGAELEKERQAKIDEHNRKIDEEFKAKRKAWIEKIEADTNRLRAEREAKERAAEERRAKERAQQQQNNN